MDKDSNESPVANGSSVPDNQVLILGSNITSLEYNGLLEVTPGQPVQGTPPLRKSRAAGRSISSAGGRVTRASPTTS